MWSGRRDRAAEQFAGGKPAWKEGHVIPGTLQNHGEEERIDGAAVLIHLLGKVKGFSLSVPTIDFALYLLKYDKSLTWEQFTS